MVSPVVREHDEAVRDAIETTGRSVGLAEAPEGALAALMASPPTGNGYYIVYPIAGGNRDGPVADPYTDIELHYQITCIDLGPEGARWLSDQIEPALASLAVTGRSIMWTTPTSPSGVWRDDDTADKSLYLSTPSYRIRTTPSS